MAVYGVRGIFHNDIQLIGKYAEY